MHFSTRSIQDEIAWCMILYLGFADDSLLVDDTIPGVDAKRVMEAKVIILRVSTKSKQK